MITPGIGDVHPNEKGYDAMGDIWFHAIQRVPRSWVSAPTGPDPPQNPAERNAKTSGSGTTSESDKSIAALELPPPIVQSFAMFIASTLANLITS